MKKRRDANQGEIIATFEKMGCTVFDLSQVGGGLSDLLVGIMGFNILVEVKPAKGKLKESQIKFKAHWNGQYSLARNDTEAMHLVNRWRNFAARNPAPTYTPID